jgi:hypothetical protein
LDYTLILDSPNQELSKIVFWFKPIFPPKQVSCKFSLNLPLFGLELSSKDLGIDIMLLTNKIA